MNKPKLQKNPFIAVVIPVERKSSLLDETLKSYKIQTYKYFKIYISSTESFTVNDKKVEIIPNKKLKGEVAQKRNVALKIQNSDIIVFNDDDVIVPKNYLQTIVRKFNNKSIIALCGPLLTPVNSSTRETGSGAVWESYMGSIGAGVYRSRKMKRRIVYDYPAANLIFRSFIFKSLGGFQKGIYPGEDTKLCLDLYQKYKKGVQYYPDIYVYHKRKELFKAHLKQIGRYGMQRGKFSLSYPKTSFKLSYFLPSLLTLYAAVVFIYLIVAGPVYNKYILIALSTPVIVYFTLVFVESLMISFDKGIRIGFFAFTGIILTHMYYGYNFIKGFTFVIVNNRIIKNFKRKK